MGKQEHRAAVIATKHQLKASSYLFRIIGKSGGDVHSYGKNGRGVDRDSGGDSLRLSSVAKGSEGVKSAGEVPLV
jgi:hypothetical protein